MRYVVISKDDVRRQSVALQASRYRSSVNVLNILAKSATATAAAAVDVSLPERQHLSLHQYQLLS